MKIEKSTIVRAISVLIVIVNSILERFGVDLIPTNEAWILMLVEYGIEAAILIAGFWYNNSFSQKALKAQEYLKQLRESE